MRVWVLWVSLSVLLFVGSPAVAKEAGSTLPKSVQGRWGVAPADCERDDAEGRLIVEPRIILFAVTGYDVKRIVRQKDGTLKITGFVSNEGEGGREKGGLSIKLLSADRLQVDKGTVYRRCG
jgi:hypothetical protein